MQLTTVFTLLTAAASVASAAAVWDFKGYSLANFGNLIVHARGGLSDNVCIDLVGFDNTMSSFRWDHGTDNPCRFRLYDLPGCQGQILATSMPSLSDPNLALPPPSVDNKASSLGVDCFTY